MDSSKKSDSLAWLAYLISLFVYTLALAPTISWGDSAKLTLHASRRELFFSFDAHFLHTLFAQWLHFFPLATFPVRVNFFSAATSALATLFACLILEKKTSPPRALFLSLAFAFSHVVFFVSTVAESYSLMLCLLSASLYFLSTLPSASPFLLLLAATAHPLALLALPYFLLQLKSSRALLSLFAALILFSLIFYFGSRGSPQALGFSRLFLWATALGKRIGYDESSAKGFFSILLHIPLFAYQFPSPLLLALCQLRREKKELLLFLPFFLAACFYGAQRSFLFFAPANLAFVLSSGAFSQKKNISLLVFSAFFPLLFYPLTVRTLARLHLHPVPARTLPMRSNTEYFLNPIKSSDHGPQRFAENVFSTLPPKSTLFTDFTPGMVLLYEATTSHRRPDLTLSFVDYPFKKLDPARAAKLLKKGEPLFLTSLLPKDYNLESLQKICLIKPFAAVFVCQPKPSLLEAEPKEANQKNQKSP